MANEINKYPAAGLPLPAGIKPLNRDPQTASGTGFFVVDSLSVDYRIHGFLDSTVSSALLKDGIKYIINDTLNDLPSNFQSNYSVSDFGSLNVGDVVVYNANNSRFELWWSTVNQGISGPSGGAFGYIQEEANFYGYMGSALGWQVIGRGVTGNTGNTGSAAYAGAEYVYAAEGDVDAPGEVFVATSNNGTLGERVVRVHRNGSALGNVGATSDLFGAFFPNGTDSSNDDTNPEVLLSLYNDTKDRTFAIKTALKSGAVVDTNELEIDPDLSNNKCRTWELVSSNSGLGTWSGEDEWAVSDVIYILAISDGVNGSDGATGATGQGITFGGLSIGGELQIQYLDADGNNFGDPVLTGIVSGSDGATGEPGEVGYLMSATGSTGELHGSPAETYWGNNIAGNTEDLAVGEIFYTNIGGDTSDRLIAVSYNSKESTQLTALSFGLTAGEIVNGTQGLFVNRPGNMYFYRQVNDSLVMKSFLSYTDVHATGISESPRLIQVKGIQDSGTLAATHPVRLGITLGTDGSATDIFTLIVPSGVKGVGITFGAIVDNTLFLDYIDENGNTFGRFESVSGITGPQGTLNPFNVPFIGITDSGTVGSGNVKVTRSSGMNVQSLTLSVTGSNSDYVGDYFSYPVSDDNQNNSGFISVFSSSDVTDFGVFRFDAGTPSNHPQEPSEVVFGSVADPLVHVAGNITNIIDFEDGTKGFTSGEEFFIAINTDGPRGFSGESVGFTYGNEYFITTIAGKPTARTDGNDLEIGDKWFCTDVGLEFTYLGVSGDGFIEQKDSGDDGNRTDIWVQTNNARQGRQGPKGDRGSDGLRGIDGATGLNNTGQWSASGRYKDREALYITRQSALDAAINDTQVNGNWDLLLPSSGATAAYFVVKTGRSNVSQVPGAFVNSGDGWSTPDSDWLPVITNAPGEQGEDGAVGSTGDSVVEFIAEESGNEVFLKSRIRPEGGNTDGSDDTVEFIQTSGGVNVNFRGPQGEAGNISGSNNVFVYKTSTGAQTSSSLVRNARDSGVDQVELVYYREKINSSAASISGGLLTCNTQSSVGFLTLSGNSDISSIELFGMEETGDSFTLYIYTNGNECTANLNDASTFTDGTTQFNNVFISNQGQPNPGRISFPTGVDSVGAFTFKLVDSGTRTLVVNYVNFVTPE